MKKILPITAMLLLWSTAAFPQTDKVIEGEGYKYVGQYPAGKGVLYSDSLGIYIGTFENARPEGICTYYGKDGSKYHGMFRRGKPAGYGRLESAQGDIFVGDFQNGTATGRDTIHYTSGAIYAGSCLEGSPHGRGANYDYGSSERVYVAEGEFLKGKLHNGYWDLRRGTVVVRNGTHSPHAVTPQKTWQQKVQEYNDLASSLPRKFPGAPLTKEQKAFLKKK